MWGSSLVGSLACHMGVAYVLLYSDRLFVTFVTSSHIISIIASLRVPVVSLSASPLGESGLDDVTTYY